MIDDTENPEVQEQEPVASPDAPETVETTPPETDGKTEPQTEAEAESEPDETEKRLARLAHDAREARRETRRLQQELAVLKGQRQDTPDADLDRRVNERAQQLAAQQQFNTQCNKIYEEGVKQFGRQHFESMVQAVNEPFGGVSLPLIEACIDAGDAHKILAHLGDNPDVLDDIAALPPHRLGAAVAKLAQKLSAPRAISKAPKPVANVHGNSRADFDPMKCSMEEYIQHEEDRLYKQRQGMH